jgi:hypothetical protein
MLLTPMVQQEQCPHIFDLDRLHLESFLKVNECDQEQDAPTVQN